MAVPDSDIAYYLFRAGVECERARHHANRGAARSHLGLALGYIERLRHLVEINEPDIECM